MKKALILSVAAAALALALVACSSNTSSGSTGSDSAAATPPADSGDVASDPATLPGDGTDLSDSLAGGDDAEGGQIADALPEPDSELAGLVEQFYGKYPVELMMLETQSVDLASTDWMTYNTGLEADWADKIDAAVFSESMTGSQAYSLVVLRMKDATDAQAAAETMLENIDCAKWVCVMADEQRVMTFGDKVVYVMADKTLTDVDQISAAVKEVMGQDPDFELAKTTVVD